jgi:hypothetical protein
VIERRSIKVSLELLSRILVDGLRLGFTTNAPEDMRIVSVAMDLEQNYVAQVIVESAGFPVPDESDASITPIFNLLITMEKPHSEVRNDG